MDFLTEEELFELQHQDEMDAMDELDIANEIEFEHNFPKRKETEIKTPKATEEEKENIPVHIPSKRRLSFSDDEPKQIIDIADSQSIEDSSLYSQSLIQESAKRTLSQISDLSDDNSTYHSAKKTCRSYNETFENFLNESLRSQARPSFFAEVRNFSKDQQMITCIDGCRKYYSVKEEEDPNDLIPSFSQRTSSLLSTPIDVLKAQYFIMEEEELKRKEEELKRKKEEKVQTSSVISMDTDITEEKDAESSLWVEKYRPISYMHLLSEEGINRTLLQWLKLWDKVVFGKDKKAKKKAPVENKKPFPNPKFQTKYGELIEELDEHGRPYHKVAFLCGPPGLGKTTLAIIIAKHAGYNIVEINASDDRSPEVFRTNLEAATQMKAVLHEDKRPNCLILDEIDGAPAPSINVLLSFIKSTGIPKGKRKKGDIPLLMRPIICICNDQYSPALKPLRQIALVLNFPPTTTSRLTSRLNEICMRESLLADIAALTLLCEKTTNDIRSCLSTLQFIQRMKRDLKVSDLEGLTLGQKDIQKNLFQVWQDIFHCSEKPSFDAIYHTVNSFGDYDKIYIGIFENYANVKFKYRNANFVWDGADWLCFGDVIQREINHSQSFFLMSYLPYPPVAFHLLFASNAFPHIAYPAAFYEYKSRSNQLSNTMISLVKDIVSTMKCFLNSSLLLLDVFPFLVEIIKPTLRPVNTQLYSEREKNELKRVIELMLAFNLNYRQERLQDGTYTYVLDPNIEELIKFSNVKSSKVLTYSAKQMIAREVEMEQMRKGEAAVDLKIASQQEKKTTKPPVLNIEPVKKTTVTDRPVLDFFGRQITEDPNAKKKAKGDPRDEEVWFHFKEGYSNAVRKTIYVKDLL